MYTINKHINTRIKFQLIDFIFIKVLTEYSYFRKIVPGVSENKKYIRLFEKVKYFKT